VRLLGYARIGWFSNAHAAQYRPILQSKLFFRRLLKE
jgi:hypothetical protein